MCAMEKAGAAIAVHGYRHTCSSSGKSLLGIHRHSEFAGVDPQRQREWIQAALAILREHGLDPKLWVAPRHGFDRNTLRALRGEGINHISDGFARIPCRRYAVTWIPQQLWAPVAKTKGLWTICIHPMTASAGEVDRLQCFLRDHWAQFTSFDLVVRDFDEGALGLGEQVYERVALWRAKRRARA
jgi:predicted deacetylase